jgi:hypothetical protein
MVAKPGVRAWRNGACIWKPYIYSLHWGLYEYGEFIKSFYLEVITGIWTRATFTQTLTEVATWCGFSVGSHNVYIYNVYMPAATGDPLWRLHISWFLGGCICTVYLDALFWCLCYPWRHYIEACVQTVSGNPISIRAWRLHKDPVSGSSISWLIYK